MRVLDIMHRDADVHRFAVRVVPLARSWVDSVVGRRSSIELRQIVHHNVVATLSLHQPTKRRQA